MILEVYKEAIIEYLCGVKFMDDLLRLSFGMYMW